MGIAIEEAKELAQMLGKLGTINEVESMSRTFVTDKWHHLFTAEQLAGFKAVIAS